MKRLCAGFVLTALLLTHFQPFAWSAIPEVPLDKSDNLAPVLVSFNFDYVNAQAGSTLGLTIVVRDDKNQTQGFIVLELLAPTGAGTPQRQEGYYYFANPDKTLVSRVIGTGYIEETWKMRIKVPTLVGQWSANRLVIYDSANNSMQFNMGQELCSNRSGININNHASTSFIDLPCQYSKALQVTTDPSREQLEVEAKVKSETDARAKAAADKAAADKTEIRSLLDSVASQITSLRPKIGENNVRVHQSTLDRLNLALQVSNESGYSEIRLLAQKTQADLLALEQKFAKQKKILKSVTITCVKGKLTKKVTAASPKCPSGYKKK
jgi:hypothetical protein